ncbi:MAG: glycosyltransferase [Gammaproteobacteria bacterium]|nr:glycosyltransferase [Gammaproteobacteria bacterium]
MNNIKNLKAQGNTLTAGPMPVQNFTYANRPWSQQKRFIRNLACRSPVFYLTVLSLWLLTVYWFHDRLFGLTQSATGIVTTTSLMYFVIFTQIAWLYGIYNLAVVVFSSLVIRRQKADDETGNSCAVARSNTPVAVLYTTCNDFVLESAVSCLAMKYANFKIYILDDSSDPAYREKIDRFASLNRKRVQVVRRPNRRGFKAGNLNYALKHVVREPLFVIADADEIMPPDFLCKLVPRIEEDPNCGFIQANHKSKSWGVSQLEQDMGIGIDIHWARYQPLRNYYGFVMFLGHGALLRTECWKLVGGFPELVSEDLAYALAIREYGFYGTFARDVVCFEEFPSNVRAFRVRHVKWTRGTCEFLNEKLVPLLRSPFISWVEKIDILFPTLNLPLTFFFFLFMLNAGILIPMQLGELQTMTVVAGGSEFQIPLLLLPDEFNRLFTADFFAITMLTIMAPVLCFIVDMWRTPIRLFRFLCNSTVLYAALSPLSMLCVSAYLVTGKARFLVTGDTEKPSPGGKSRGTLKQRLWKFLCETHPDHPGVALFEMTSAAVFIYAALVGFQVSFLGIALAFFMLPVMHYLHWQNPMLRVMRILPLTLVLAGLTLGGFSLFGIAPMMFGFGFHF